MDLHQLAVHARFHRDGVDGGDVAQTGDVLADIAAGGLHRDHRNGAKPAAAPPASALIGARRLGGRAARPRR